MHREQERAEGGEKTTMVTLRKRVRTLESLANQKAIKSHHENTHIEKEISGYENIQSEREISGYEQCRDRRIKENMERMQRLGILDLAVKLKYELLPPKRSPRKTLSITKSSALSPLPSSQPTRRSSRLQNVNPINYSEQREKKKRSVEDVNTLVGEGSKPEIYTEEHGKLLGTCEESWALFVDGYGNDGKRIYDPVKGKTCHQCRQKTLGHRTRCSKCNLVQGQFCGDCLYTRYGENVLEANKNPDWICPVCRGVCNCSLCRQAKGWRPTGYLYRRVLSLGFKSVAHYLIQTRRSQTNLEEDTSVDHHVSAKRSLPFADSEENSVCKGSPSSDRSHHEVPKSDFEEGKSNGEIKGEEEDPSLNLDRNNLGVSNVASESNQNIEGCTVVAESNSDSIAGRLRQRRNGY